jgi:photosystem II stability/assembly factor-like uncharacterized protein
MTWPLLLHHGAPRNGKKTCQKVLTSPPAESNICHVAKAQAGRTIPKMLLITASLTLLLAALPLLPAAASSDAVRWNKVNTPAEGRAGGWVLAAGSDIRCLTATGDGTLYAGVPGLAHTLYRSTDGGRSWAYLGSVQDNITAIAVSPHDADIIYYATAAAVYRSADGGRTFAPLPVPGGAGSANITITSLTAVWRDGNIIAVGTRDADAAQYGGVYTFDETQSVPGWADTGIGSYDIPAVAFSPGYPSDQQLVAVATDETETLVITRTGSDGWGEAIGQARLKKDNAGPVAAVAAAIAFPGDYDAGSDSDGGTLFVGIDTGSGQGDVYKITGAEAADLNIGAAYGEDNIDVTGLAASGSAPSASLLAGAAASARTYASTDGGQSWSASRKPPTGASRTCVLIDPGSGMFYAATSGGESALSLSQDGGGTWDQASLVDTTVSALLSPAPSPNFSQDGTLFLLTAGGTHSLWRSRDGGQTWARVFASALDGVDSLNLVSLPPEYGPDSPTVFIAGQSGGTPALWKSTDDGQSFRRRFARDPTTGDPFTIDRWAVADNAILFIGSYDGSQGLVYRTANGGVTFSEGAPAGGLPLNAIALSPDYAADKTILVGNIGGGVYWSDDDGASFEPLPADAASPPLTGVIAVAFDPRFASNRTVYAASDNTDAGVYRFVIGASTDWESADSHLPGGARLSQLATGTEGTLYAANAVADGGLERGLNPASSSGATFETVTRGLSDGATLGGLWSSGHRLWAQDTTNNRLMTFNDTLTVPVTVTSPEDDAAGIGSLIDHTIRNAVLDWATLEGATSYQWQLAYDGDLASVPDGFDGTTQASSIHLPDLEPATTYHWRVRAKTPVLSPWSAKRAFTTSLDTEAVSLSLESPLPGAGGVPVKPLFQWNAVAGADAYELLVATDADFSYPAIIRQDDDALAATAWQCDLDLDYSTTYYWKVRGISADSRSAWSAIGAFTTEPPPDDGTSPTATAAPTIASPNLRSSGQGTPTPAPSATPAAQPPVTITQTPTIIQNLNLPAWAIYLAAALLGAILLMLLIILALAIGIIKRSD